MMFELVWTQEAKAQYEAIRGKAERIRRGRGARGKRKSSKQEGLFKQVHKALRLLEANPRHPGLQTHEYLSLDSPYEEGRKVFEAYVQQKTPSAYRIFWCYGPSPKQITVLAITPHP